LMISAMAGSTTLMSSCRSHLEVPFVVILECYVWEDYFNLFQEMQNSHKSFT
jgi:hypothetical protein